MHDLFLYCTQLFVHMLEIVNKRVTHTNCVPAFVNVLTPQRNRHVPEKMMSVLIDIYIFSHCKCFQNV